jgi:hypothetical protein
LKTNFRIAYVLLLASQLSHASLLLSIDANTGKFEWTDSGTVAYDVQITQSITSTFFLANYAVADPTPPGATIVTGMVNSLSFSLNPPGTPPEAILTPTNTGQVYIDAGAGLFSISLGTIYSDTASPSMGLSASAAAPGTTFAGFTPAEKTFLSSLNGSVLNFYQLSGGTVTKLTTQYPNALEFSVVPIPEPSTFVLLLTATAMLFRRRRLLG